MRKLLLLNGLSIASLFCQSQAANITLKVNNIEEVKGDISIAIFNNSEGFPSGDNFYIGKKVPVNSKEFEHSFDDIPIGTYAIAIYHDIDKNGELDKNWFGIPKEPYGFSYKETGKTGSAKFDEATFELKEDIVISISLID